MSAALEAYSLSPTFACSPLRVGNLRRELSWQIQPIPTSTRLLGIRRPRHIPSYDNSPASMQLPSFERKRKADAETLLLAPYASSFMFSWVIPGSLSKCAFLLESGFGSPERLGFDRHDAVSSSALDPACLILLHLYPSFSHPPGPHDAYALPNSTRPQSKTRTWSYNPVYPGKRSTRTSPPSPTRCFSPWTRARGRR